MRLIVDIYKTKDLYSGLGQFSLNFANELIKHRPGWLDPVFLVPPGKVSPDTCHVSPVIKTNLLRRYFPGLGPHADIWHSLHQFPSHLPHPQSKFILTVHDLNFLTEKEPAKATKYLKRLQKNVNRAAAVTVISDYTGKMLSEHIDTGNKKLVTIHDGVRLEPRPDAARPVWLPDGPFFFSLSVFKEKKNFHTLIPMMEHFPGHTLVLGGNNKTPYGERIRGMIRDSAFPDNIILPGTLGEDEKYYLYKNCRAFLFPSLAEGFGLPVVEAMMAGKQVFLSRMCSLPEVGGVLAFYWDSFDAADMAAVLRNGLELRENQPDSCSGEIIAYASRFSWQNCITKFLDLYQGML